MCTLTDTATNNNFELPSSVFFLVTMQFIAATHCHLNEHCCFNINSKALLPDSQARNNLVMHSLAQKKSRQENSAFYKFLISVS